MMNEVRQGELRINGLPLPLRKGIILLALAKAGWTGTDGVLTDDLMRRLFLADPRIAPELERMTPAFSKFGKAS